MGLDEKTEKVYVALLKLADAPAAKVARESGLKRTSVYHVLENLASMGLASSYIHRGVKRYAAENPSRLKAFFEQKAILAERLTPILQNLINEPASKVKIKFFDSLEGLRGISEEAFFWRTSHGAELDLLTFQAEKAIGFEFKFADAPKTTKSMHQAITDLKLDHLYVIYPGQREIPLTKQITALGLEAWVKRYRDEET